MIKLVLPLLSALAACAPVAQNGVQEPEEAANGAVLVGSVPADGAAVDAPQSLAFTFREPVRLIEVMVVGPSGEMPMMVTAAGAQSTYEVPLPDLEPGLYRVRWRALTQSGESLEGSLGFTVR